MFEKVPAETHMGNFSIFLILTQVAGNSDETCGFYCKQMHKQANLNEI